MVSLAAVFPLIMSKVHMSKNYISLFGQINIDFFIDVRMNVIVFKGLERRHTFLQCI